jgi:hypothetical protein
MTRIRFRIESESFASRPKESESYEHDFAGIFPALQEIGQTRLGGWADPGLEKKEVGSRERERSEAEMGIRRRAGWRQGIPKS